MSAKIRQALITALLFTAVVGLPLTWTDMSDVNVAQARRRDPSRPDKPTTRQVTSETTFSKSSAQAPQANSITVTVTMNRTTIETTTFTAYHVSTIVSMAATSATSTRVQSILISPNNLIFLGLLVTMVVLFAISFAIRTLQSRESTQRKTK